MPCIVSIISKLGSNYSLLLVLPPNYHHHHDDGYTVYHGYTKYIQSDGYTWYIQGYTMYIPWISLRSTYGINQAYTRHIPEIGVPDGRSSRCCHTRHPCKWAAAEGVVGRMPGLTKADSVIPIKIVCLNLNRRDARQHCSQLQPTTGAVP
jgi:hypothetical protein